MLGVVVRLGKAKHLDDCRSDEHVQPIPQKAPEMPGVI